jgi:ADP-dependent phosphofructokinase/glucokinase
MAVDRVCVHADDWALSVTRGEPRPERDALIVGCLLAATRAAAGHLAVPSGPPADAAYRAPPRPTAILPPGWQLVCCAAPYLRQPRTTLGLGDTFLAGTMLVLGQTEAMPARPAQATATATTEG